MSYSDLPTYVPIEHSPELCMDECCCLQYADDSEHEEEKEDRRLVNWKNWLEKRKKQHQNLGDALNRDPGDLVMNAYEDYRMTKEEKLLFDYTNIKLGDKYRGCPSFFEPPVSLPHPCNYKCPTEYIAQQTKEDKCEIPDIEYVRVPKGIMVDEKQIFPKRREGYKTWSESKYRQEQFLKLAEKISMIEPHKPDISDLMIQGVGIKKEKWEPPVHVNDVSEINCNIPFANFKNLPQFIINYSPIFEGMTGLVEPQLIFEYDVNSGVIKRKKVKLENRTNIALRFRFLEIKKNRIFSDIRSEEITYDQAFFYDKNLQIILPGEIQFFSFILKTNYPKVWWEKFELKLYPDIFPGLKIILHLTACAEIYNLQRDCLRIKERINNKVKKCLISDLIKKANKVKDPILFKYNKKEIFEAINTNYDPYHRQVKYFYNKQVVDELEKFYEKIRLPTHNSVWNLNLYDLRAMTKEREITDSEAYKIQIIREFYEEIDKDEQEEQAKCHAIANCEEEKKGAKKEVKKGKEPSKLELPTIVKKYDHQECPKKYSDELEAIIDKLETTKLEPNYDQEKYDNVYTIITVYFDKLCDEIANMKEKLGIPDTSIYPILTMNEFENPKYEFEQKREYYKENLTKVALIPPKWQSKRPAFMDEIPLEDYTKRYKIYFNIPDEEEGGKKKKGKGKGKGKDKGKKDKGKKDKNKGKKGKKGKKEKDEGPKKETCDYLEEKLSKVIDHYKIDDKFDPVYEPHMRLAQESHIMTEEITPLHQQVPDNSDDLDEEQLEEELPLTIPIIEQYLYNLHLMFYMCLNNIVTSVCDYLDNLKIKLPPEEVKMIVDCKECGLHYKHKEIKNLNYIDLRYILSLDNLPCFQEVPSQFELPVKDNDDIEYATDPMDQQESLFSLLQVYKQEEEKPISYPRKVSKYVNLDDSSLPTFHRYTETSDPIVNEHWSRFKDEAEQTDEKLRMSTKLLKGQTVCVQDMNMAQVVDDCYDDDVSEFNKSALCLQQKGDKILGDYSCLQYLPQFCSNQDQYYYGSSSSNDDTIYNAGTQ